MFSTNTCVVSSMRASKWNWIFVSAHKPYRQTILLLWFCKMFCILRNLSSSVNGGLAFREHTLLWTSFFLIRIIRLLTSTLQVGFPSVRLETQTTNRSGMKNDMAFFQYASKLLRANVGFASDGGSGTPKAFTFIQRTTSSWVRARSSPFVYVFVRL